MSAYYVLGIVPRNFNGLTHLVFTILGNILLKIPFGRWGNWHTEKLIYWAEIIKLSNFKNQKFRRLSKLPNQCYLSLTSMSLIFVAKKVMALHWNHNEFFFVSLVSSFARGQCLNHPELIVFNFLNKFQGWDIVPLAMELGQRN